MMTEFDKWKQKDYTMPQGLTIAMDPYKTELKQRRWFAATMANNCDEPVQCMIQKRKQRRW